MLMRNWFHNIALFNDRFCVRCNTFETSAGKNGYEVAENTTLYNDLKNTLCLFICIQLNRDKCTSIYSAILLEENIKKIFLNSMLNFEIQRKTYKSLLTHMCLERRNEKIWNFKSTNNAIL